MDDSNKPTLFTFGKLKNSHSEESLSDSLVEDPDSGKDISSKINGNHQELVKKMESLNSTDSRPRVLNKPSDDSCTAPHDVPKIRIDNGLNADAAQPRPRYGIYSERRNLFGLDQRLKERNLTQDDEIMLPSEVTDKEYIYMPSAAEETDDEDINTSGKWMVFPKGDLQKLDQYWLALITLYKNGTLTRLKCSTAMGSNPGVINCYTVDSENAADVKNSADSIRECIDYDTLMYYKTNVASALGLYKRFGNKNISKYMHTVKKCLYEKDAFGRWKIVPL